MLEKKIKWTEQQKRAIESRGSDVLVTASAGTGKTAVLSGRCIDIVSDKSICPDVWSVLVLTFTDMAAEEMRCRIAQQLRDALAESSDPNLKRHLHQQIILLPGADISTIHSFCKRLITEYFYKLALDPVFKVIDADEARLLKTEVLEKTIEWAWQQSDLQQTLPQLLYRRDLRPNEGFLTKIIEISDFLDGVVSRQNWYERAARLTEIASPFSTSLGEKQKQIIADKLQQIFLQISFAMRLYESRNAGGNWAIKWKETFAEPVAKYIELIKSGSWERFSQELRNHQRPSRYEYKPKELEGTVAEIIKNITKASKESFDQLFDLAVLNPDYLDVLSSSVGSQTLVLIRLLKKFDQLYSLAKSTSGGVNCMDFADLEHYALKLLVDEKFSEGRIMPSEVALALRRRYKNIFVDEYQDINSVQRLILDMLSPGGNILQVGDVKQSIYAFRGAEPDIFIEQLKLASTDPQNAPKGLRVDLNANFRSVKGILNFVNKLFSRIMTASGLGRIDYDESAQLKPALLSEQGIQGTEQVVEFHILDETGDEGDLADEQNQILTMDDGRRMMDDVPRLSSLVPRHSSLVSSRQRQAAMIARRIKQMVGAETGKVEFQIYDKELEQHRDVEYRDIVILMRSLVKKAEDYVEVLHLAGVPVSCQATAGYFEATEVTDMLALLKVLDNPQRDIELAAVLRSPFFNVSDSELAKIKIHSDALETKNSKLKPAPSAPVLSVVERVEGTKNYYDCAMKYIRSGPDAELTEKLKDIFSQLEHWRTLARRGNLADLIWQIYRQTHFLPYVSALPAGQARRANLLKLHDRAIQFEGFVTSSGMPSLMRFISFIEKLQESGQDWSPAEPAASVGNAVRILSVHKSKGLEFPVVFLAELNGRFNKEDISADVLADASDTLGLQVIDRSSNSKLSSLAHQVIAEEKLTKILAEEMRILYVATTRARDRLILTACQKANWCKDIITNGFLFSGDTIPDWLLRDSRSLLDWILFAFSDQKSLHNAFETGLSEKAANDDLFGLKLYTQAELLELSDFILKLKAGKSQIASAPEKSRSKKGQSILVQLKKDLAWQYRFGDSPFLPAKLSVSQLTHHNDEYVKFDYSKVLERQPNTFMVVENGRVAASSVAWGWIGTATHLVISQLDLTQSINEEAIQRTKEKLLTDGAVPSTTLRTGTEDIAEAVNTDSILAFFGSELGRMALDKANTVWREWPFTFALNIDVGWAMPTISHLVCGAHPTSDERRATSDDIVIVQGIIDMLIRTPQGLVVIDFKTDNITAKQVPQRAELYRRQIDLYAMAACAILKQKLHAKWLYFLTPWQAIEI